MAHSGSCPDRRKTKTHEKCFVIIGSYGCGKTELSLNLAIEAADVPVVSPKVNAAFDSDFDVVIFEAGGDPAGATALGQYWQKFVRLPQGVLQTLFVVNTRRPLTQTEEDILDMLCKAQRSARLTITGIPICCYGVKKSVYEENRELLRACKGAPILIDIYT